jgi:hypothetical protein
MQSLGSVHSWAFCWEVVGKGKKTREEGNGAFKAGVVEWRPRLEEQDKKAHAQQLESAQRSL